LGQERQLKGAHSIKWDGKNNIGTIVPSGSYYHQIISGKFISSKNMIILK
jgi:flagellar hook assembly protein FlgD